MENQQRASENPLKLTETDATHIFSSSDLGALLPDDKPPHKYIYISMAEKCDLSWFCRGSEGVPARWCRCAPVDPRCRPLRSLPLRAPVLEARLYVDHVRTGRGRQINRENSPPAVYTLHKQPLRRENFILIDFSFPLMDAFRHRD